MLRLLNKVLYVYLLSIGVSVTHRVSSVFFLRSLVSIANLNRNLLNETKACDY
jgi:hypothetical protein